MRRENVRKQPVKIAPQEIASLLQPGTKVVMGACNSEPQSLAEALAEIGHELTAVEVYNVGFGTPCLYAQKNLTGHLTVKTFFPGPPLKKAIAEGWAEYIPCNYSDPPKFYLDGIIKPDLALVQLSPPDEDGMCNLGIAVDYNQALIATATTVVAEINRQMPRTCGETLVPFSSLDFWVEADYPLPEIPPGALNPNEVLVGENVAGLIPDGSCIQVGIGNIIEAILTALRYKKDLSIHSGTIGDKVIELIESGVVTNSRKKINQGKSVATNLMGTNRLYKYAHKNSLLELYPSTYTHSPAAFLLLPGLIAINSALEVDLSGQVNAETINGRRVSGSGGQLDFMRGAAMAGGKAIIALPSTTVDGERSRILPFLGIGESVTTPRMDAHYVVTEYGVASLKGKSLRQRAQELIRIAHPNFRDELRHHSKYLIG